jgi:NADH dehydrogenase
LCAVTGAFGYTGKYIARRLLDAGYRIRTLTNSPYRQNPFGSRVEAHPFNFDNPDQLVESLRGASTLYNTYWIRFNFDQPGFTHATAVKNSLTLFEAARLAGVKRIVHTSIANPSEDSPLEYYRGKARLERGIRETGLSYAILRPTVIFGPEDILINNIAWILRRFPIFGVFGDGQYHIRPIFVEDYAKLAVEQGQKTENIILDAVCPESFTYREMVGSIGRLIGAPRPIVSVPPIVGYIVGRFISGMMRDVTITREEIQGLLLNLLDSKAPATGETKLTDWVKRNASTLGVKYANEVARRKNRQLAYENL